MKLARSYELSERLTAFSQSANSVFYCIHVRRKTGEWRTEVQIRQGKLPNVGDRISVILSGETVAARVGSLVTKPNPAKGRRNIEVLAEEI